MLICNILDYVHARIFHCNAVNVSCSVYVYIYTPNLNCPRTYIYIYICNFNFKFTAIHLLRIIEAVHYVGYMLANNIKGNYQ